jgi:rRNA maturation endonuclease Nob1
MPEIVKTKKTVYSIKQVAIDFAVFNERWREIRGRFRYKGFECYACNKHFQDGESIGLIFTDRGNKTVCKECGTKFKAELLTEAGDRS